jgi:hypothetical protein
MNAPQNSVWGPALWMLLHSSAERIGSQVRSRLPQEEIRIWAGLLSSLRYSLPCPLCKKHYTEYFASHSFTKETIRTWLFQLHFQINQQLNKSNEMDHEQLSAHYNQPFQYSKYCKIVEDQMILSLRQGWCQRNDLQRSFRFFEELKRFYDFF